MKVLINLTNHPSSNFTKEQKNYNDAVYDKVIDLLFPVIEKKHSEEDFILFSQKYRYSVTQIIEAFLLDNTNDLFVDVCICGEDGMAYVLVNTMKELSKTYQKITYNRVYMDIVYPSSPKEALEGEDGKITHLFKFYMYRRYL